jgi:Outer membrane protein beta-barrel domain
MTREPARVGNILGSAVVIPSFPGGYNCFDRGGVLRRTLRLLWGVGIAAASLVVPLSAAGQSVLGPTRIGGIVGGSIRSGESTTAVGITASYRVGRGVAVEADMSRLSDLKLMEFTDCEPGQGCGISSLHARVTSVVASAVFGVPSGVRWLRPYLSAGFGAAGIRRDVRGATCASIESHGMSCESNTRTEPVISAGGGFDFLVWRGLGVGLDVRYLRVSEDEPVFRPAPAVKHLTRIGSVVSYRF